MQATEWKCNSRQCLDIVDTLIEASVPLYQLGLPQHEPQSELWRAVNAAKLFLYDCLPDADFWRTFDSITKLDTREAYDVLIHDLIWAKAASDVFLYIQGNDHGKVVNPDKKMKECDKYIRERVQECTSLLSSSTNSEATQLRLDRDRRALMVLMAFDPHHKLYTNETQQKCLAFLLEKFQALHNLTQSVDNDGEARLLKKFEIDPYELGVGEFIGSGSFAEVYRSSWLGRPVALKKFRAHVCKEEFGKEASMLASLRSPFIVDMVGWCVKDGECMLVMEAAHTNLGRIINEYSDDRYFSMHAKVDIMRQISEGMVYLHRRRIIHRDIKPNNVLLQPAVKPTTELLEPVKSYSKGLLEALKSHTERLLAMKSTKVLPSKDLERSVPSFKDLAPSFDARVKLCDFGIAKVKQLSAKDQSQYTTLKQGSGYYRAPEVLVDITDDDDDPEGAVNMKYTRKADVYSFAMTCAEILGGFSATSDCYGDLSSRRLRAKQVENVRPKLPAECPSHLRDLITRCWDTDPKLRPRFSTISRTLTYIKFVLMRCSDPKVYDDMVYPFDEEELRRRAEAEDEASASNVRD